MECSNVPLNSSIKLIGDKDGLKTARKIGAERFFLHYSHFQACSKVFKPTEYNVLCNEANILSKFCSTRLLYLFGVCICQHALTTGFDGASVTLHHVITDKSKRNLSEYNMHWKSLLVQISEGIHELHCVYKVLHNDLKNGNIVLAPCSLGKTVNAIIIDFGKASNVTQGKRYHLIILNKKSTYKYKVNYPQIAPDL